MKKHLVIAGKRHTGKSTLIGRILENTDRPLYGFRTAPGRSMKQGCRSFFIHPADAEIRFETEENHIGDGNGVERTGYPEAFDGFGLRCLEARPDGIIVMDELGFMEKDAKAFCSRVLELFDGDIPVIAAAKAGHDIGLLNRIFDHPDAEVVYITEDNRDDLYEKLRDWFL